MSEFPAVENLKEGTGRTAAEVDEKWRSSKAAAFSAIAEEAKARAMKTARLRALRLKHGIHGRAPMHEALFSPDHQEEELNEDPEETGNRQELSCTAQIMGRAF
ncbi:hypothetical protein AB4144_21275 [Rhizobiaceae sp. 2RAB30]